MHEMSIVRRLLDQVTELQRANGGGNVREIRVQVGPLSGVEAELMLSAFALLRGRAQLESAALAIDEVPLLAHCRTCSSDFAPVKFHFSCPACGAASTEITQGEAIMLESITLDDTLQEAAG